MKVVLDANVFVSGTLTPAGLAGRILNALRTNRFILCTSDGIVSEVSRTLEDRVLATRYGVHPEDVEDLVERMTAPATVHQSGPVEQISAVRDPKDNMVLESAIGCQADLVVTNDDDLLALREFRGVGIVSLRDFLRTLGLPA